MSAPAYLTQEELSAADKAVLAGISEWLSHADFDPNTNVCIDKSLQEKWALLRDIEFIRKVNRD